MLKGFKQHIQRKMKPYGETHFGDGKYTPRLQDSEHSYRTGESEWKLSTEEWQRRKRIQKKHARQVAKTEIKETVEEYQDGS